MKKIINVLNVTWITANTIFLIWLLLSFIEVLFKNVSLQPEYMDFNLIKLFINCCNK